MHAEEGERAEMWLQSHFTKSFKKLDSNVHAEKWSPFPPSQARATSQGVTSLISTAHWNKRELIILTLRAKASHQCHEFCLSQKFGVGLSVPKPYMKASFILVLSLLHYRIKLSCDKRDKEGNKVMKTCEMKYTAIGWEQQQHGQQMEVGSAQS